MTEMEGAVAKLGDNSARLSSVATLSVVIAACWDALADKLDWECGHLMIDPELYERDAHFFGRSFHRDMHVWAFWMTKLAC
jgi:hypothetical protein